MTRFLTSRWFHTLILLALLGGAVAVRIHDYKWAQSLRFLAFDAYNRITPRAATGEAVIVDIDEESLGREDLGQWPWSRLAVAKLVDNLAAMGAKAVVFDMVFAEADRTSPDSILKRLPDDEKNFDLRRILSEFPDNDSILADAIRRAGNVVTAFIWSNDDQATRRAPVLSQPILIAKQAQGLADTVPQMVGVTTNLPVLAEAGAGSGSFGVSPEVDGIIRRVPLLFGFSSQDGTKTVYPSLAVEAVRVAQGAKTVARIRALKPEEAGLLDPPLVMSVGQYEVPLDRDGKFFVWFSPERQEEYVPAWEVVDGVADPDRIKDKIVFVGTSAEGLKDIRSTPLDLFIPGVEVHANVVEQILRGNFLKRPQLLQGAELLSAGGLGLLIILLAPFAGAVIMALLTFVLIGAIGFVSWYMFSIYGLLFDPVYPSLCLAILFVMSSLLAYVRAEADRQRVKSAFGLYISPDFMKELTSNPDKLRLGGETRDLTVMFTDIRNFTSISESMKPEELTQLMNDFLTPMSDLVMSNRGTIDKYMGDAMMAFWNAPLDDAEHARHACRAALQMNRALDPVNKRLLDEANKVGRKPIMLKAGIGINTGPASVGNMGSRQRFAYSALGDTVNLASRLEGQTKTYQASILIGPETKTQVPDFAALEMDLIRVKGRDKPVRVYALLGDENYAAPEAFRVWNGLHENMIAAYRAGEFREAERLVGQCKEASGDRLHLFYDMYLARLTALKAAPPGSGWDGVYAATEK